MKNLSIPNDLKRIYYAVVTVPTILILKTIEYEVFRSVNMMLRKILNIIDSCINKLSIIKPKLYVPKNVPH